MGRFIYIDGKPVPCSARHQGPNLADPADPGGHHVTAGLRPSSHP
jgi:hypothetical protein